VWSPDGRLLAFSEIVGAGPGATSRFRIAQARGGLLGRAVDGYAPAWSPDGKRIVFVRGKGLGVLDVRTRRVWRIPLGRPPTTYVGSPDWSPDGRRLAVTNGGNRVSVVSAKGGGLRLLGLGRGPRWSPDGRTIAARAFTACGPRSLRLTAKARAALVEPYTHKPTGLSGRETDGRLHSPRVGILVAAAESLFRKGTRLRREGSQVA
jgi:dipeptidyl aminopeptidase/acylaminoacyl peptidase